MPIPDERPAECMKNDTNTTGNGDIPSIQIDELGLTGLSALLTFSPNAGDIEFGERRAGRDRRAGDRRVTLANR